MNFAKKQAGINISKSEVQSYTNSRKFFPAILINSSQCKDLDIDLCLECKILLFLFLFGYEFYQSAPL